MDLAIGIVLDLMDGTAPRDSRQPARRMLEIWRRIRPFFSGFATTQDEASPKKDESNKGLRLAIK